MSESTEGLSPAQCLRHWARSRPEAVAVIEAGRDYSYAQLATNVLQYVQVLRERGLRAGMLVGISSQYRYLHFVLRLACEALGAAYISLSPFELDSDAELQRRCHLLCLGAGVAPSVAADHPAALRLDQALMTRIDALPAAGLADLDVAPGDADPVELVRSSGTTGTAKFMPLTGAIRAARLRATRWSYPVFPAVTDVLISFNFTFGTAANLVTLAMTHGKTIRFTTAETMEADAAASGVPLGLVVPVVAVEMLERYQGQPWRRKLTTVRSVGGPVPAHVRQQMRALITDEVSVVYGAMECYLVSLLDDADESDIGQLCPGVEVRILGQNGEVLPAGQTGFIEVRSDQTIAGYAWNAGLTARHFDGGWFRTFDLGTMPRPGRLQVLGRGDDVLNIGGVKIAPGPVEAQIKAMDGVVDAVLIAVPDRQGIDRLHIVVERRDARDEARIHTRMETEIDASVGSFAAHYCDALPRTGTGKVLRHVLRQQALALQGRG